MFQTRTTNPNAEADQSTLESDKTPTYTSNLTTAALSGRDSVTDTLGTADASKVATPNYIYYRIYAEDGSILSKAPAAPDDPFLGRIKARSVPPPHTVKAIKHSIAKVEDIKDRTNTSLFLTPYSESPMGDADKVNILNRTAPGSTPREPLALVAKVSDAERSNLESGRSGGLVSAAGSDTKPAEIRHLYYLLYADEYEIPSKVAIDPEEPCLGRIRADSVAPPHSPASIKRCISRVEKTPAIAHADLYANISCDTPLKEGYMAILRTDGPGLSPNEPMAIVQSPIVQVESPSIPDGKYVIKNRATNCYWNAQYNPIRTVHFMSTKMAQCEAYLKNPHKILHWDILHDTNGNISMTSPHAPSSWVGADLTGSTVPVPWRLVPAGQNFYYLTTDLNPLSEKPRVPASASAMGEIMTNNSGTMATLKEGDQRQMWEFIRI